VDDGKKFSGIVLDGTNIGAVGESALGTLVEIGMVTWPQEVIMCRNTVSLCH
jgi:hypothetical protein